MCVRERERVGVIEREREMCRERERKKESEREREKAYPGRGRRSRQWRRSCGWWSPSPAAAARTPSPEAPEGISQPRGAGISRLSPFVLHVREDFICKHLKFYQLSLGRFLGFQGEIFEPEPKK